MPSNDLIQRNGASLSKRSASLISRGLTSLERIVWTSKPLFEFEEGEFEDWDVSSYISPDGMFFHSYICDDPSSGTGRCYVKVFGFDKNQDNIFHYLTRDDFVDGRQYLERDSFGGDSFGDNGTVLDRVTWSSCGRYLIASSLMCSDTFVFHLVPGLSKSLWFPDSHYDTTAWSPDNNFIINPTRNEINVLKAVWSDDSDDRQLLGFEPYKQIKVRKLGEQEDPIDSRKQGELEALFSNLMEQIAPGPRAAGQFIHLLSIHFSIDEIDDIGRYMTTFLHRHFYEYPESNGLLGISLERQLAGERGVCYGRVLSAQANSHIKTSLTNRKKKLPARDESTRQLSEEIIRRNAEIEARSEEEILSDLREATVELEKLDFAIAKYEEQWESGDISFRECSFSPDGELVYSLLEFNSGYSRREAVLLLINEFRSFGETFSIRLNAPRNIDVLAKDAYSHSWLADQRSLLISIDGTLKEIRFNPVNGQFEFIDHDAFGHIIACNPKSLLFAVTNAQRPDDSCSSVTIKRYSDFSTIGEYELPSSATSLRWNRDGTILWALCRDGMAVQAEIPARMRN